MADECVVCTAGLELEPGIVARWPFCHHDVCGICVRRLDLCPVCRGPGRAGLADMFPSVAPDHALFALSDRVELAASGRPADHLGLLVMLEGLVRVAASAPDDVVARVSLPVAWVRRALSSLFLDMPTVLFHVPHSLLGPWGSQGIAPKSLALAEAVLRRRTHTVVGAFARQVFRVWDAHAPAVERRMKLERVLVGRLSNLPDWAVVEVADAWEASGIGARHPQSLRLWNSILASGVEASPTRSLRWIGALYGAHFDPTTWTDACRHAIVVAGWLCSGGWPAGSAEEACAGMPCERCDIAAFVGMLLLLERTATADTGVLAALLSLRARTRAAASIGKRRSGLFSEIATRAAVRAVDLCGRYTVRHALLCAGADPSWVHSNADATRRLVQGVATAMENAPNPEPQPARLVLRAWVLAARLDPSEVPPLVWSLRPAKPSPSGTDADALAELVPDPDALCSTVVPATGASAIFTIPTACLWAYRTAVRRGEIHRRAVLAVLVQRGAAVPPFGMPKRWKLAKAAEATLGPITTAVACPRPCPHMCPLLGPEKLRMKLSRMNPHPVTRNAWLRLLARGAERSLRAVGGMHGGVLWEPKTRLYQAGDPGVQLLTIVVSRLHRLKADVATAVFVHALYAQHDARDPDAGPVHRLPTHTPRGPCRGPLRWSDMLCARSRRLRAAVVCAATGETTAVCGAWKSVALALYGVPPGGADPSAACTCPGTVRCRERFCWGGPVAWDALMHIVRTGEPPPDGPFPTDPIAIGLCAWAARLTARPMHSLPVPAAVAVELWLAAEQMAPPRLVRWAAEWFERVVGVRHFPSPVVRALVRLYARPSTREAGAALELGLSLLRGRAPSGEHRVPAVARARFFAALDADLRCHGARVASEGAVDAVNGLVYTAEQSHCPPKVVLRIAATLGRCATPSEAAGLVSVCAKTRHRRLAGALLPAMLWRAACPRPASCPADMRDTGAAFRRAQAAMGNGVGLAGTARSGAWVAIADLPPVLLTAQVLFVTEDAPQRVQEGAAILSVTPPPPLDTAGDRVVRFAAGGLVVQRWPRGGMATLALGRRGLAPSAARVARGVRRWVRDSASHTASPVQALAVLLLLHVVGPSVRPRDRRRAFARAAKAVVASGSALCASIVLSAAKRARAELGALHVPPPGRLRDLFRTLCVDGLDFVERLEGGLGWTEALAVARRDVAVARGPQAARVGGSMTCEPVSVFLHAVAAFGPPCMPAGCGMVGQDDPSQCFVTTLKWLAALRDTHVKGTATHTARAGGHDINPDGPLTDDAARLHLPRVRGTAP